MADPVENCSICFEELEDENREEYKLSCDHVYHRDCISQWLNNHTTCPLCRADVDPIDQYVEDEIISPDRLNDIRDEISQMRVLAHFGAYGLEGLGSLFFTKSRGLGAHLGNCVNGGLLDEGFERIARRESGGWLIIVITVAVAIITHFAGNE